MATPTPRRSGASSCRASAAVRRTLLALTLAAPVGFGAAALVGAAEPVPESSKLLGWVRDLSDPAMEGRAAGTPGADRAAAYVAGEFQRLGLRPAGDAAPLREVAAGRVGEEAVGRALAAHAARVAP